MVAGCLIGAWIVGIYLKNCNENRNVVRCLKHHDQGGCIGRCSNQVLSDAGSIQIKLRGVKHKHEEINSHSVEALNSGTFCVENRVKYCKLKELHKGGKRQSWSCCLLTFSVSFPLCVYVLC